MDQAESDLLAVDLDGKIKSLTEAKNNHQRYVTISSHHHHHVGMMVPMEGIASQLSVSSFHAITKVW